MSVTTGDDLKFAKEFADETATLLSGYFTEHNLPPMDALSKSMTRIQSGAKTLRARAIYQGAQSVLQAMETLPVTDSALAGRLLALNKLVVQYAEGLAEIYTDSTENAPVAQASSLPSQPVGLSQPANDYIHAKAVLADLLPLTRKTEATHLTRLMTITERSQRIAHAIEVESFMRDIVEDALAIARISAKTISISYDVRNTVVTDDFQAPFQVRISRVLRALILETLPKDGVGHIDITADKAELCIKVTGPQPSLLPSGTRAYESTGTTYVYVALKDTASPETETQHVTNAPRRMITDETETGLREQLSQLMEPNTVLAEVGA